VGCLHLQEENDRMGVILMGIVVAVAIAIGAGYILPQEQKQAWQVYSTTSTRVGDPGENLVGSGWTGESTVAQAAGESPT
jgi:hypothetical protein